VGEQLRSIIDQDRRPDEVVVADDASTDETAELAAQVLAGAPPDVVTHLIRGDRRMGLASNLERALSQTSGEIVLFADQDDVWERHKTRVVEERFAVRPTLLLAFSDAWIVDARGDVDPGARLWDRVGLTPRRRESFARDPLDLLLRRTVVTGATMAVHRRLLDVARPLPAEGWHDAWLALVAALAGPAGIAMIDAPLIRYRLHGGNLAGVRGRGFWSWYWSLRWPRDAVLRQWTRALVLRDIPEASHARLREAIALHEARRGLPAAPVARAGAVLRRLPSYRRLPGGGRALVWDLTSPLVSPDSRE
jgi:glycosyltransferase involved in cell wall biosynthesis